jgi:hypothetical protein
MNDASAPPPPPPSPSPAPPPDDKAVALAPRQTWLQSRIGSDLFVGLFLILVTSTVIPLVTDIIRGFNEWRDQKQELNDTATFIRQETLRRLDFLDALVKTAASQRQIGERIVASMSASNGGSGSFGFYPRFRNAPLEDLLLHIQGMSNSKDMEPINALSQLRLLAINLRDGNGDKEDQDAGRDVSRKEAYRLIEIARIWAKAANLDNVTHFVKKTAQTDVLIRTGP